MTKAKKVTGKSSPWHYVSKGDLPAVGEFVWVQAVSLAPWAKAVVKSEAAGSPVRFQTEAMYCGRKGGLEIWENLTCHDVVVAWRAHESPEDHDAVRAAVEAAQRRTAQDDIFLFFVLASALDMNPVKMRPVIQQKMTRFKKRLKEVGETAFVNENTPVVDTYCPDFIDDAHGLVFGVEERFGQGVIVQTVKGQSASSYAKDLPSPKRIYPTAIEAARALCEIAKTQKWRAVV